MYEIYQYQIKRTSNECPGSPRYCPTSNAFDRRKHAFAIMYQTIAFYEVKYP